MAEVTKTAGNPNGIYGYGAGTPANASSIDRQKSTDTTGLGQMNQFFYDKAALIAIRDEMLFSRFSGTRSMPKHYGKTIKKLVYIPLLDDKNLTDKGLDKNGAYTATGGKLYGSSRNIGTITSGIPDISETGGRVNRVGFTREEISATIKNRGFFFDYTKDDLNFDSDKELYSHLTEEALRGANQLNEDILVVTLIEKAGVALYAEGATITGANPDPKDFINQNSLPSIEDLYKIDITLDNNKCPKDTTVITGSRMIDTKVVQGARFMFISSDVKMDFMRMKDLDGKSNAFVKLEKYQDAATGMNSKKYVKTIFGEIGMVGPFRIVVAPKMVFHAGEGAAIAGNTTVRSTGGKFNVYPCLVIGSGAFTHIGFEMGTGAKSKFIVKTKKPGETLESTDPYGKTGFTSIQFWNGVLVERPEWLATYNVAATI